MGSVGTTSSDNMMSLAGHPSSLLNLSYCPAGLERLSKMLRHDIFYIVCVLYIIVSKLYDHYQYIVSYRVITFQL